MNKWDQIPNEILDMVLNILEKCEKEDNNDNTTGEEDSNLSIEVIDELPPPATEWMIVNKQWYKRYLSKKYKSITTSLTDEIFHNIVYSVVPPGIYVENVIIMDMPIPADFIEEAQVSADLLIKLISKCPNVINVEFSSSNLHNSLNWLYLATTLSYSHTWKLKSIPKLYNCDSFVHYFQCAIQVRETLQSLSLTKGMMFSKSYLELKKFKSLTVLQIEEVFHDIIHLYELLLFVPGTLENIEVTFSRMQNTTPDKHCDVPKMDSSNIRFMKLINYTPRRDKEIIFLTEKFTRLKSLIIYGYKEDPSWPSNKISRPITRSFFEFLHKIPHHIIEAAEVTDEDKFINQYYADQQFTPQSCLTIISNHRSKLFTIEERHKILVRIEKDQDISGSKASVLYSSGMMNDEMMNRATNVLISVKDSFNEIRLITECELQQEMNAQTCTVLSHSRDNLQTLKLRGGLILRFPSVLNIRLFYLTRLQFEKLILEEDLFTILSKGLPNLAHLDFISCDFRNVRGQDSNAACISLPRSDLKSITFSVTEKDDDDISPNIKITNNILIISIISPDQIDQTNYYMTCARDTTATKLSTVLFRQIEDSFMGDDDVSFIEIRAKSVETLKISSPTYNLTIP